jgi:PAS domain S-box-containing protein
VERLRYSDSGVLWALLNDGIARIEYPSRISHFEPLITSGLTFAAPLRHDGNLWILADGRVHRGIYDKGVRLDHFEVDSPPGRFVFTLQNADDQLFGCTEEGIYRRDGDRWVEVARGIVNARILPVHTSDGSLAYIAREEMGTLTRTPDGYALKRIVVPDLGQSYNAWWAPAEQAVWVELGISRVARVDLTGPAPKLQMYGPAEGLNNGWTMIFVFDGIARFQLPNHLYTFDPATQRFVEDEDLRNRYPAFLAASSRPMPGPDGKTWYAYHGRVWSVDTTDAAAQPQIVPLPFMGIGFVFEQDGVVWSYANRRLVRYDPSVPDPAAKPGAIITGVEFPASSRQIYALKHGIGTVPFADNTVVFHFAAPGNRFSSPATFEVRLEGASDRWVPTGTTGQAAFNRLKEGSYVFHVRAVTSAGETSPEASIAFGIDPPWFRSSLAWVAYIIGGTAALAFAIWYPAVRQRRENARLEMLVTARTKELHDTNRRLETQILQTTEKSAALAVSEDRYRRLSGELEHRVEERTAELSISNRELQQRESLFRLIVEHAPVGISWKRADRENVHRVNDAFRSILDLPSDTFSDYTLLSKMVHPEDAPRQREMTAKIESGEIDDYRIEQRFMLPDGREVWGSLCVAVVRDSAGAIVQVIGILEDITARKRAETQLAATYKELVDASRMAGMAEVATGVLHNVGNVLNSLNVSSNLIGSTVRQSKAESLGKLAALFREHHHDLAEFLTVHPKGRLVPELLNRLAEASATERAWLQQEIASMQKNIDHIKDIVSMQQSYATVIGVTETTDAPSLFEDALRMNSAALSRHDVKLVREFLPVPAVCVERGKVLQILINLIRNAKYACDDGQKNGTGEKVVTVRIEPAPEGRVRFIVRDNGIGIPPENLTRIFAHGFTTRSYGHGFGLHSSAIAAREMRGSLTGASEGLGHGATFTLELPAATTTTPSVSGSPFATRAVIAG